MQGRLRGDPLSGVVETECAHCSQPLHIEIDSELAHRVVEDDADPIVFAPSVDFDKLEAPSIIDAF